MAELLLLRSRKITENALRGTLFVNTDFNCFTLENFEKRISAGTYKVEKYQSPRFKREVLLLTGVKGRDMIEIHPANYPDELEGCIAVGSQQTDGMVLNSRDTFNALMKLLRNSNNIEIEVRDL